MSENQLLQLSEAEEKRILLHNMSSQVNEIISDIELLNQACIKDFTELEHANLERAAAQLIEVRDSLHKRSMI